MFLVLTVRIQDPRKGNVKPVGQREWTPNPVGAWTPPNYAKQVGGGFQSSTTNDMSFLFI